VVSKSSDSKKTGLAVAMLGLFGGGSCCDGTGDSLLQLVPATGDSWVRSKTSSERMGGFDDVGHFEACLGGVVGARAGGGEELDNRSMTSATIMEARGPVSGPARCRGPALAGGMSVKSASTILVDAGV
jgi:hypothetical protein